MGDFDQNKYIQQFQKENYDRLVIQVPKGEKALIDEYRKGKGYKSLNAYVNELIKRDMEQNATSMKNSNNVIIGNIGSIHME